MRMHVSIVDRQFYKEFLTFHVNICTFNAISQLLIHFKRRDMRFSHEDLKAYHHVLLAALRAADDRDIDSLGNPMARAVLTAIPLYI